METLNFVTNCYYSTYNGTVVRNLIELNLVEF